MKFPRTPHLPWSRGVAPDDRTMRNPGNRFAGHVVVITEKMDGENTVMTRNAIHARSEDSGYHASRTWVKNLWGEIRYEIPEGWSIVGENLYARHSILYDQLPSYFLVFAIINNGVVLSSADTALYSSQLGLYTVPVLHTGNYRELALRALDFSPAYSTVAEGYVLRQAQSFLLSEWGERAAKFVRASHVQTSEHWMHESVVKNELDSRRIGRVR